MPYCSSSGHFAGLDDPEVEIDSDNVDGNDISFDVRITRPCSECGDTSAEYETTLEYTVDHECPPDDEHECSGCTDRRADHLDMGPGIMPGTCTVEGCECDEFSLDYDLEIDSSDADVEDYMQTHTRAGKPIKAGASDRYRKRLFAVTVTATLRCQNCGEDIVIDADERDIPASAFPAEAH